MEMNLKKNKIKVAIQKSWKAYHLNKKLRLKTPNEILVRMVGPLLKKANIFADLGSGSQNNSLWLAENKKRVFSIDYAQSKNIYKNNKKIIFKNIDLTDSKKFKFIKQNNIDFVIIHQFIDHILFEDALKIFELLNNVKTIKYIFVSFLTTKSLGSHVVGKKFFNKSYLSPIAKSLSPKFKELHTFYTKKDINTSLKVLSNFYKFKRIEVLEKYFETKNKKNIMVTDHYLLKKSEIK